MDQEEKEICTYLKEVPGRFISGLDICRRAGGKWRYREDPEWALPFLARLAEKKVIESDSTSHYYRLVLKRDKKDPKEPDKKNPQEPKNPKGKWLSPQMRAILEKSGKKFEQVAPDESVDEDEDGAESK
jgi:hypothetical protein